MIFLLVIECHRHSVSILEEEELRAQLIWKLGLRELSKDDTISSQKMVSSPGRLTHSIIIQDKDVYTLDRMYTY